MQYLFFSLLTNLFVNPPLIFISLDNKTFKTLLQIKLRLKYYYDQVPIQTKRTELHSMVTIKKIRKVFICLNQVSYSRYTESKFYINKERYIYQPDESLYKK